MTGELDPIRRVDVERASRRVVERVVERARRERLDDVLVARVDSPVGTLLVAATRRGVVRVAFPEEPEDAVLQELADDLSPRVLADPRGMDPIRRQLEEYFEGRRRRFETRIDWSLGPSGFSRKVLEQTARIPYGTVSTYGEMARRAGSPRAARAAGNALHDNPVPIVVPCHRVVPAGGGVGKYGGSEWRKQWLLRLEGWLQT